jgi:hypothetical protein
MKSEVICGGISVVSLEFLHDQISQKNKKYRDILFMNIKIINQSSLSTIMEAIICKRGF